MRDFTLHTFKLLLTTLKDEKYTFQTFADFLKNPQSRAILLRHDVDARKLNSLRTAQLENEMGIVGTYNFRMVPQSYNETVIREIASLGHEIGYHYEDLAIMNGNFEKAIRNFENNLVIIRHISSVETICMHGSPLSKYDNRKLWGRYNYRDFGIIGEPYFDLDYMKVMYLTDTGRRWDGEQVSVRDKVIAKNIPLCVWQRQDQVGLFNNRDFHSTFDIISSVKQGYLPDQIAITIHPQRWDNRPFHWMREFVMQNVKNQLKRLIVWQAG